MSIFKFKLLHLNLLLPLPPTNEFDPLQHNGWLLIRYSTMAGYSFAAQWSGYSSVTAQWSGYSFITAQWSGYSSVTAERSGYSSVTAHWSGYSSVTEQWSGYLI